MTRGDGGIGGGRGGEEADWAGGSQLPGIGAAAGAIVARIVPEYSLPRRRRRSRCRANVHVFMHVPPPGGCARAQRRWWHTRARAQANNAVRRRFDHAAARAGSMRARKAQQRCGVQGARNASSMMGKSSIATVILGTHPRWWRIGRWRRSCKNGVYDVAVQLQLVLGQSAQSLNE